ncbi:site-2 protease family protein [Candidatus Woesearchaeota archaeon]|nr:site-2 protease family protein [Candidatus Woesearchaeota archaeon]
MGLDAVAALVFAVFLGLFLWQKRRFVELQGVFPFLYVVMYRSSFGLKGMSWLARRFPRFLGFLGDVSIVVGFVGMIAIVIQLVWNTFELLVSPAAAPGIQPVLPFEAKGVFFVPFAYWIVSIFLLALVHEFSHGVLANVHKMRVKSSGFAFLGILLPIVPAAFVEPDEKVVQRRPARQQLAVFAAGPFSNGLFALLALGLFFAIAPVISAAFVSSGVELSSVAEDGPAFVAGLRDGAILTGLDGVLLVSPQNLSFVLSSKRPGDSVDVQTRNGSFSVVLGQNPKNVSQGFLGVQVRPFVEPRSEFVARYGSVVPVVARWFAGLFFWLFLLNIGIGLFNLLPVGPLDGGRMFQLVCTNVFGKKGLRVWAWMSFFLVSLLIVNLLVGIIR